MLTINDVRRTLNTLYKAGKVIPTNDMEELSNFWLEVFKSISPAIWQRATQIAVTMPRAGKVNINIATPALMSEAIKLAEAEHVNNQVKEAKELDKPPSEFLGDYARKQFALWTRKRTRQMDFSFVDYKPSDEEVVRKLGELRAENNASNRMLVKMYLTDVNMGIKLKHTLAVKDKNVYYKVTA